MPKRCNNTAQYPSTITTQHNTMPIALMHLLSSDIRGFICTLLNTCSERGLTVLDGQEITPEYLPEVHYADIATIGQD